MRTTSLYSSERIRRDKSLHCTTPMINRGGNVNKGKAKLGEQDRAAAKGKRVEEGKGGHWGIGVVSETSQKSVTT